MVFPFLTESLNGITQSPLWRSKSSHLLLPLYSLNLWERKLKWFGTKQILRNPNCPLLSPHISPLVPLSKSFVQVDFPGTELWIYNLTSSLLNRMLCSFSAISLVPLQQFLESRAWELETAPPLTVSVAAVHAHFTQLKVREPIISQSWPISRPLFCSSSWLNAGAGVWL